LIQQILITCKFQPETARLDEMLVFEWCSGIEPETTPVPAPGDKKKKKSSSKKERKVYKAEALMYDMVMTIATIALGRGWAGCDSSAAGDFKVASQNFCKAAGIMEYMEKEALPQWNARGSVPMESLPSEATVGVCKGLKLLFLTQAQQMAVATVLIKPGTPNYGLLAKLCLSVSEKIDEFVSVMRKEAFKQMAKMDKEFFTLLTFQIYYQRSLSLYFQARQNWDDGNYGMGIALLSEAAQELTFRTNTNSAGLPDVSKTTTLHTLDKDLKDFQTHLKKLLKYWEDDNSSVYFDRVPPKVTAQDKLQKGHFISKVSPFTMSDEGVDPLPLVLPNHGALQRSDSDLARQLEKKLNM